MAKSEKAEEKPKENLNVMQKRNIIIGIVVVVIVIALIALLTRTPPPTLVIQTNPGVYGQSNNITALPPPHHPNDVIKIILTAANGKNYTSLASFNTQNLPAGTYHVVAFDVNTSGYSSSQLLNISKAPLKLNLTAPSSFNFNATGGAISFSISSLGNQVKGTLYVNGAKVADTSSSGSYTTSPNPGSYNITFSSQGNQNYTSATTSANFKILPNMVFMHDQTLNGNIDLAGNVTIEGGVTLTTDGYSIIAGGTFANYGTIITGYANDGGEGGDLFNNATPGGSYPYSYGGAGGVGGGCSTNGGSTLAKGGYFSMTSSTSCSTYPPGQPPAPNITNAVIQSWYTNGIANYLTGAGGGGSDYIGFASGANGGSGAYGIFIQANKIIAGNIEANGQTGGAGSEGLFVFSGGGGGGGGGAILLAYGSGGYVPGTYSYTGGIGGSSSSNGGGQGGNGQLITYNYVTPPISVCNGVCIGSNKYLEGT